MRILATTCVLGILATSSAFAAYTGPTAQPQLESVQAVLEKGKDDQTFRVTGYIVERLKDEEYRFTDTTGSIRAEIDDDLFFNVTVNEKTKVELTGRVDASLIGDPELDVKSLRIVQ